MQTTNAQDINEDFLKKNTWLRFNTISLYVNIALKSCPMGHEFNNSGKCLRDHHTSAFVLKIYVIIYV